MMMEVKLTADQEKGIETMVWLDTLSDIDALSYICTWIKCTILGRGLDVRDTLAAIVGAVRHGTEKAEKGAEHDNER